MAPLASLLLALLPSLAAATYFDNLVPRLDNTGAIMDSHDFSLRKYPGDTQHYYMTSIAYGTCKEPAGKGCDQTADHCGFKANHTINVWKSADLSSGSWEFVTEAVSEAQRVDGTIFRPDGIWNPNTNEWVLWYNAPNYVGYSAYTAPSPAGPYTRQRIAVNVSIVNSTQHCGDFHLFIDPVDNTPYVIGGCNFLMWIERLNPDMLSSPGDVSPTGRYVFSEYFIEAPALFYRAGLYYAVFGHCCCYCYQGSGAIVHTAPHPLGPWTSLGDIACVPAAAGAAAAADAAAPPSAATRTAAFLAAIGAPAAGPGLAAEPTPGQGCQYVDPKTTSALRSQQSDIFEVSLSDGSTGWIWAGDRWQQSWDGTKAHDPQLWVPLDFNADGSIKPLRFLDNFTMDVVP